jgi:hypothetical protein
MAQKIYRIEIPLILVEVCQMKKPFLFYSSTIQPSAGGLRFSLKNFLTV